MFKFRQSRKIEGDSFNTYHTRLEKSARNGGFTDKDREIKAQLTIGCTSTQLRRKILEKRSMTFLTALEAAATKKNKM
jgi:hypothetical protein